MALTDNLEAYYKLEDVTDSHTDDDLTNNGSVSFLSGGIILNSANFGASNTTKYLSIANALGNTGGAYSIAGWVNVTTAPAADSQTVLFMSEYGTTFVFYSVQYTDAGGTKKLQFFRGRRGVADEGPEYTVTLTANTWYHIAVTYDGTNVRGYVDGTLQAGPTAASGDGSSGGTGSAIARFATANIRYHSGLCDEVGFWTRAITAAEVSELYNAGSGLTYPFTTGTQFQINVGDVWKEVPAIKINIGDAWKDVASAQINIGDAWKSVF